jgi:hypothetical protein
MKEKIETHNLIVTRADKGKIVIMKKQEYTQHIEEFINENNYILLQHNPTKQHQKTIMNTINKCNIHINKSNKHKFYKPKTEAPTLRATIKIHKNPIKIRPIVNWKNAPAYQLATQTSKFLTQYIQLPYTFNVTNTTQLIEELRTIPVNTNTRVCSFDITNMCTNIPTTQIKDIIITCLNNNNVYEDVKTEISNIINIIIEQNYFQFNNKYYKQKEGLAMGAPSSAILSEIYLQYIEHSHVYIYIYIPYITKT